MVYFNCHNCVAPTIAFTSSTKIMEFDVGIPLFDGRKNNISSARKKLKPLEKSCGNEVIVWNCVYLSARASTGESPTRMRLRVDRGFFSKHHPLFVNTRLLNTIVPWDKSPKFDFICRFRCGCVFLYLNVFFKRYRRR